MRSTGDGLSGLRRLARAHVGILVLVTLAGLLRVAVMLAYKPAFWFPDSGSYVWLSRIPLVPHYARPLGYVLLLKVLKRAETYLAVVAVQHLIGLALGVTVYAFLRRRGVFGWLSCVAAAVVLFDSLQVTLEHYILTEAFFTALLVAGLLLLLWPSVPSLAACAGAGLLFAGAWFTRPNVLPIATLLGGYLVLRRVGWRRIAAFAVTFALPYIAVVLWVDDRASPYGSSWTARNLVGRTATFADCGRLVLTPDERKYCPTVPVDQRSDRGDFYVWNGPAAISTPADTDDMMGFAVAAIRQQPGDYARVVARDVAPFFVPWWPVGPDTRCLFGRWTLPETTRDPTPYMSHCHADLAAGGFRPDHADTATAPPPNALTRTLHVYSTYVRTPVLAVTGVFLLALIALIIGRRPGGHRVNARDAGLLAAASALLIVPPVMISMYEIRYALPALPLLAIAGALAGHHLRASFRRELSTMDDPCPVTRSCSPAA